ncbi:uncharacterized protein CDV56_100097, partial [Aspergillus thermomutatus]
SPRKVDGEKEDGDGGEVVCELKKTLDLQERLPELVGNGPLDSLMGFIVRNEMFDSFCEWLGRRWKDHHLFMVDTSTKDIGVAPRDFMAGSAREQARMLDECRRFLQGDGMRILVHRERYLLELVGEIIWTHTRS